MVAGDNVGDGGLGGLDVLFVGQDDDMAVSLEVGKLRESVVHGVGDVLQIHTDGVADADA